MSVQTTGVVGKEGAAHGNERMSDDLPSYDFL